MADSVKIKITGDASEFQSTLSGIKGTAGSMFKGIMASQIVTKGVSLLTGELKKAMTAGMQFEAAMSQVAAISGATGSELELLTETAKHYGETTMFSASQAAEALNYMALAGWDANQSVDALGGVLDLAAASGMDLGAASDAVTDYLSAFSMEASQAGYMADMMAYAQSRSNTTASMLADAYGNCASSMHAAGQDIETTTAMLMALANQGIKGSEAGTQMAAVMRDLTQKMDDGQIMIGKTAVKVTDAAGNFRDLNDIVMDVGKATEGMGTAEQSAAIMTTFTARSVKAIQTLLNEGMDNVNAYEDALRGSEGTAAEQARIMMDNLQGDIKLYQSALEGVRITASESLNDSARGIVQEGTNVLDAMNQAGKTQGIGGMFDAAIAQIPRLLPKAVKGVEGLLGGIGKRLPGLVKNLISTIPDVLGGMGELVPGLIDSLGSAFAAAAEGLLSKLPDIMGGLVNAFPDIMESLFRGTLNIGQGILQGLGKAFGVIETFDIHDYEGLDGKVTGHIDLDAEVSYAEAQKKVDDALNAFIAELKGYGLTTEQIAQVLAFKGTTEELTAWLETNFPDLDAAAKAAIQAKFTAGGENGLASLFTEGEQQGLTAEQLAGVIMNTDLTQESVEAYLTTNFPDLSAAAKKAITDNLPEKGLASSLKEELMDLGLKNEDIAAILTAKGEGDDQTIEDILNTKYSNVKQQAIDALTKAWNSSTATFGAEEGSMTFMADLIKDMFTDGIKDDDASVDAALETAKAAIDKKKKELIDYIKSGGEDQEGAQDALNQLEEFGKAYEDYATNLAGASTAECEAAGQALLDLASKCDEATARILKNTQELQSYQGRIFAAGARGELLSNEDAIQALNYIKDLTDKRLEAAQKAKEDNVNAGMAYEDAERIYTQSVADAMANSKAMLAQLIQGQAGGVEGAQLALALAQVKQQFLQGLQAGEVSPAEVADALRAAGYSEDVISQALGTVFQGLEFDMDKVLGEESFSFDESGFAVMSDQLVEQLNRAFTEPFESGLDITDAEFAIEAAYEELGGNLNYGNVLKALLNAGTNGEGFTPSEASAIAGQLFQQTAGVLVDSFDGAVGSYDFGVLGNIIAEAADAGMIDGLENYQRDGKLDTNKLIMDLLAMKEPVEAPVPVEAQVEPDEDTADKVTEAVEEVTKKADKVEPAKPEVPVEPEVKPDEGTAQKVNEATEQALEGTGETTQTVDATADVNMTIGNVSVSNGSGIGNMIAQQLSGQAVNVQVDINANVGSVKLNGGAAVNTAARQLVSDAIRAAQGQTASAASVGRNMASGLASGILAGRGAVVAAARSVAQAAANAMRSAMQIHSPSKVTEGFGRMFDQGLVVGIDKGTKDVVSSAVAMSRRVAGAANLTPRTDFSGLSASMGSAMNDFAEAESSRQYVFRVNGRDLAMATSRDYGAELNGFAKRINMGYGRG